MRILAIETSCDETSAAVVEGNEKEVKILSHVVASSMEMHSKTGGIIPENAAREQVKYIIPVINEALEKAGIKWSSKPHPDPLLPGEGDQGEVPMVDAIAVTYGPGLIGSLLVGVETAKTLSYLWNKPLIPVNHLFGHIYANFVSKNEKLKMKSEKLPEFPLIALIVSGGHTDIVLMKSHTDITWLGGTRDDAAGECFDKSGRLLGLSYPAGPEIEKRAAMGNPKAYHFPRPLLHEKNYDFSFSGLKTAILREVELLKGQGSRVKGKDKSSDNLNASPFPLPPAQVNNICRGLQDAIIDVLIKKTLQAAEEYNVKSVLLSGGVAANTTLREKFKEILDTEYQILNTKLFVPTKSFCTDNAAMIGAAALFQDKKEKWEDIAANPELYFD